MLGSGLGALAKRIVPAERRSYRDVPGLEAPTVAGHEGTLTIGAWAGQQVMVFEGRLHFYEGYSWTTVLMPVRIARQRGARILLTTNAAGGIRPDLEPGRLMIVTDHVDWTGPRTGHQARQPGPHSPRLVSLLQQAGRKIGLDLPTGTYAQVTGPCYETPAEIRALRSIAVDAVGMSTAREIEAGAEIGLECAALSCITNRAAGLGGGPLRHEEVLAVAALQHERLACVLEAFLELIG
jgi:purine-nucleoside phosphorylase